MFNFILKKYKKSVSVVSASTLIGMFSLSLIIVLGWFSFNFSVDSVLNEELLGIISVNSTYGETADPYPYIAEDINNIEGVDFSIYDNHSGVFINLGEEADVLECLPLNEKTMKYFPNIDSSENMLIIPDYINVDLIESIEYNETVIDPIIKTYEAPGSIVVPNKCYIDQTIYDAPKKSPDNYFGIKNLIISAQKPEYTYDIVQDFNDMYPDDDPYIYYQSQGLSNVFKSTKMSMLLMGVVIVFIIITNFLICLYYLKNLFSIINKDLICLYLNGADKNTIVSSCTKFLLDQIRPKINKVLVINIVIAVILAFLLRAFDNIILYVLIITLFNLFNKYLFIYIIKTTTKKLILRELDSELIVSKIRN